MAGYNHLDAAALTQPGGFADSLVRALTAAMQGYGAVQDRTAERQGNADLERAKIGFQERQRKEQRARDLSMALAKAGIVVPGMDPGEQQLAEALKTEHQADRDAKTKESEARVRNLDANTRYVGTKGVNAGIDKMLRGMGVGKDAKAASTDHLMRVKTQKGTVLIDPNTRKRVGLVDDETGEVTWDGLAQDTTAKGPAAPPRPGEDGKVAFPTDTGSASTIRRSGLPGIHSLGDILGGLVDNWSGDAPATDAPQVIPEDRKAAVVAANARHMQPGDSPAMDARKAAVVAANARHMQPEPAPAVAPQGPPLATKTLTEAQVMGYAQKHRVQYQDALRWLTSQGL